MTAQAPCTYPADHAVNAVDTPAKAAAGGVEPVAWLHTYKGHVTGREQTEASTQRLPRQDNTVSLRPLYLAAHPVETEVADLRAEVERLKAELENQTDDALRLHREKVDRFERALRAEAALALVKKERDRAREALKTLADVADDFHDQAVSYFSDTTYDGDGVLANAQAELYVVALPKARAALSTPDADRAGDAGEAR